MQPLKSPSSRGSVLGGDDLERVLSENRGLIGLAIKRHFSYANLPDEDLIAYGNEGLIRAWHRYDPKRGTWSSYAMLWIRAAISQGIVSSEGIMRVPARARRSPSGSEIISLSTKWADDGDIPEDSVGTEDGVVNQSLIASVLSLLSEAERDALARFTAGVTMPKESEKALARALALLRHPSMGSGLMELVSNG